MKPAFARCAIAAAVSTALLAACGGSGDDDAPHDTAAVALKAGDTYTVEIRTGGQVVESHDYLVHGVSPQGELVPTASADLVPGALIALPVTKEGKSSHGDLEPMTQEELRAFYKRMADAKARRDGKLDALALAQEIDDLDTDIASLYADQKRSGLNDDEYLRFYDALDQVPQFAAQEDAEAQMRAFFEDVNEYELQAAACSTMNGEWGWAHSNPDPRCTQTKSSQARELAKGPVPTLILDPATLQVVLRNAGTDMPGLLAYMAQRGDNFSALSTLYRRWRWQNQNGKGLRDFVAFYLNGGTLDSLPQLPFGLQADERVSPRAITAIGHRPCHNGGSWNLVTFNQIVPESDETGTCIGSLKWDRFVSFPLPFTDGQTVESPPTTVSFTFGGQVLGQVTMQWRATYTVGSLSDTPRFKDYAPLITAHVSEVRNQNQVTLNASASAWINTRSTGADLTFKVTKMAGIGLLNWKTEEKTSSLVFDDGFR